MTGADVTELSKEELVATLLTATPKLRAAFFANPLRLNVGGAWCAGDGLSEEEETTKAAAFRQQVLLTIARRIKSGQLSASVNTDSVFEEYFDPIVRTSKFSFGLMLALSIGAFLAGLALIGAGIYIVLYPRPSINETVLGSVFGGGGAVSALGAVLAMARSGIREAAADHARLRVVLTGFATELGQLRALSERRVPSTLDLTAQECDAWAEAVGRINGFLRKSVSEALEGLPSANGRAPEEDEAPAATGSA